MSELSEFRDHAQRLSTSEHRDDCDRIHRITKVLSGGHGLDPTRSCDRTDGHDWHDWTDSHGFGWTCPGLCGGCMPDAERVLWTRLAAEIAEYVAGNDGDVDLFDGAGA